MAEDRKTPRRVRSLVLRVPLSTESDGPTPGEDGSAREYPLVSPSPDTDEVVEQFANSPAARMMLATRAINPLIARAEAAIHARGFLVTEYVELERGTASQQTRRLRFGKVGKEWGLSVESGWGATADHTWTSVRLHTLSREIRLKALSVLPELVDKLSARAELEAAAAMKVVTDTLDFVAALEARAK